MAKSVFQQFINALDKHVKVAYPFAQRLEKAFDVSISKASSFYLGISPTFGKHVIVTFQHSPKPWQVGEFAINVHISKDYAPASENWMRWQDRYASFEDGFYRLARGAGLPDLWWCLCPATGDAPRDTSNGGYWEPNSYEDQEAVIRQAVLEVCGFIEVHLLRKAGYLN